MALAFLADKVDDPNQWLYQYLKAADDVRDRVDLRRVVEAVPDLFKPLTLMPDVITLGTEQQTGLGAKYRMALGKLRILFNLDGAPQVVAVKYRRDSYGPGRSN